MCVTLFASPGLLHGSVQSVGMRCNEWHKLPLHLNTSIDAHASYIMRREPDRSALPVQVYQQSVWNAASDEGYTACCRCCCCCCCYHCHCCYAIVSVGLGASGGKRKTGCLTRMDGRARLSVSILHHISDKSHNMAPALTSGGGGKTKESVAARVAGSGTAGQSIYHPHPATA